MFSIYLNDWLSLISHLIQLEFYCAYCLLTGSFFLFPRLILCKAWVMRVLWWTMVSLISAHTKMLLPALPFVIFWKKSKKHSLISNTDYFTTEHHNNCRLQSVVTFVTNYLLNVLLLFEEKIAHPCNYSVTVASFDQSSPIPIFLHSIFSYIKIFYLILLQSTHWGWKLITMVRVMIFKTTP